MLIKHRIIVPENTTFEGLKHEIAQGGRFVVFSYCISLLFAVTLRRFSPAYLVPASGPSPQLKKKYNLYNYLFGWWQIPAGLPATLRNIRINNRGGLDVTEDIMLNLTAASFDQKEVELVQTNMLFDIPARPDVKALQKVIRKYLDPNKGPEALYFGNYINVADDEDTFFVIGIRSEQPFDLAKTDLDHAVRRVFYKHVRIEYINLGADAGQEIFSFNEDKAWAPLLMQQGIKLI